MRGCWLFVTDAEGDRKSHHSISRAGYTDALRNAQRIEGSVTISCATVPGSGPEVELATCSAKRCEAWPSTSDTLSRDRYATDSVEKVGTSLSGGGSRTRKRQRKAAARDRAVEAAEIAENRRLKKRRVR